MGLILDVTSLIEGEERPFRDFLDFSAMEFSEQVIFPNPIELSGVVRKRADVVTLEGRYQTLMHLRCDRCGESFERTLSEPLQVFLASGRENEDREDIFLLENGRCNLQEVFFPAVVLSVEPKILCADDCKGLCAQCGQNLNEKECGCRQTEIDPRLEALRTFFEPTENR